MVGIDATLRGECTLHQLSPYIGKLRANAADELVRQYSLPGDLVADPFCGSGTVPLQAAILGRRVVASDVSGYARTLTLAKLAPPSSLEAALSEAESLLVEAKQVSVPDAPDWVMKYFHPDTLDEAIRFAAACHQRKANFHLACLLGILHHQRPGFLSFPSSHLVPYLRDKKFPQADFPEMYAYRDLRSRLFAKICRAYKVEVPDRRLFDRTSSLSPGLVKVNSFDAESTLGIDCLITSPPYMNTLDYDRDNRLRMWFVDFSYSANHKMIRNKGSFEKAIVNLARYLDSNLKRLGFAVLILGERSHRKVIGHPSDLVEIIFAAHSPSLTLQERRDDEIPDIRRARRNLSGTKRERILVFRKNTI